MHFRKRVCLSANTHTRNIYLMIEEAPGKVLSLGSCAWVRRGWGAGRVGKGILLVQAAWPGRKLFHNDKQRIQKDNMGLKKQLTKGRYATGSRRESQKKRKQTSSNQ